MMDRQAAPRHISKLGPVIHRLDKIAVIEVNSEGHAGQVLGCQFQRRLREINAVIMADPGCGQDAFHEARIATSKINNGEWPLIALQRRAEEVPTALWDSRSWSTSFW